MANFPYSEKNPNLSVGVIKMFQRMGQYPIDPSTVFNTVDELNEYINARGSYAYPGQIVAVANGDINVESNDDFTLYVIRTDRSIQPINKEFLQFDSVSEAELYIQSNPNSFRYGFPFVIKEDDKNKIYTISKEGLVEEIVISSNGNIIAPTSVKWADIEEKPTSISEFGITDVPTTAQLESVEAVTEMSYCENNFKIYSLTECLMKKFDYLILESFSDFSSINTSIEDSQFIIDNYFDAHCRVFRKNDDSKKTLLFNPVSFEIETNMIWSSIDWEGTGFVSMYVSIDDGSTWIELAEKTEITYPISSHKELIIKINLIGDVILRNFSLGVKK